MARWANLVATNQRTGWFRKSLGNRYKHGGAGAAWLSW